MAKVVHFEIPVDEAERARTFYSEPVRTDGIPAGRVDISLGGPARVRTWNQPVMSRLL